jgi:hypothetical protein
MKLGTAPPRASKVTRPCQSRRLRSSGQYAAERFHALPTKQLCTARIRRNEDRFPAQPLCMPRRHRRANSVTTGFIGGGADHRTIAAPSDQDRLSAKLWIVSLFDGGIESVHVHMNHLAIGGSKGLLPRFSRMASCAPPGESSAN